MDADRHAFDDDGQRVPVCGFAYPDDEASPAELSEMQRELMRDALELSRHRGFCDGERAAEAAVLTKILSGRLTPRAIATRAIALGRANGLLTMGQACRLAGTTRRGLEKAAAKVRAVTEAN